VTEIARGVFALTAPEPGLAVTCFGAQDPATNVSGLQIWHPTDQGSYETSQSGIELAGVKLRSG
jgi:hypothetical protein